MKLRTRLALIVLVTALPVVAGITWARARFERHTIEQAMRDFVLARMENGGREQCEASPETFPEPPWRRGGPGREREERREFYERMFGAPDRGGPPEPGAERGPGRGGQVEHRDPAHERAPARATDPAAAPREDGGEAVERDAPQRTEAANDAQGSSATAERPPGEARPEAAVERPRLEPRPDPAAGRPPARGSERAPNRDRRPPEPPPDDGHGGPRGTEGQRGGRGFDGRRALGGVIPPRVELWAYDANFTSRNPRAPAFPPALQAALQGGEEYASENWDTEARGEPVEGLRFALRMPWEDGPCTIMLAQRPDTGPRSAVAGLLWSSLALCAVLLAAVLLAAGPIVERVRGLTAQVKESAAARYASPVDEHGRDEISELARAFNSAGTEVRANLEALETREKTLRTFVENTTHDVMLPLTVLQGHLTALRRRVEAGQLPEKETVRDALEESHYLSSLLQNLAVAARLEGGEPHMARHPVDLNALVERAVARQRPIARQKNVQVEFAVPEETVFLVGDVTFVEQMLSNVIHNAVRYNHDGGHVAVLLEERGPGLEEFALRVLDDGPGIPEELRERVVERSFRTDDARSRAPDGLGLGLSIAHDVAQRHGLTMAMRSSPAGGLEVEFCGRRARPDVARPALAPGADRPDAPRAPRAPASEPG